MKRTLFTLGLAIAAAAPSAHAATVWASQIVEYAPGAGSRAPRGADGNQALGGPDSTFASLGNGGFIVVGFGANAKVQGVTVLERTDGCQLSGGLCTQWPEQADVYVGSGWTAGLGSFATANATNGFTFVGTIRNGGQLTFPGISNVRGTTLDSLIYQQLALVDRSAALPGNANRFSTNSGFDVVAVGATPVPLPAAAWLLLSGMAGLGFVARRRGA
jgi:hypothetical protein